MARRRAAAIDAALSSIDDAELIALTRDLVRIPSVVRPGDPTATEAEVARYIERWLGKQGFSVEVHEVAPGRPNVVAWLGDRDGGPSLLLEGHYFYIAGEEYRVIRLDSVILSYPHE